MKKHLFTITTLALGLSVNAQVCFTLSNGSPFGVGSGAKSTTSADFNTDGKADLAVTNAYSDNVSILLGNGFGSFATAVNFATGAFPISVTNADFNADGKVDLAVANTGSSNVSILLGNGAGSFATAVNFVVGNQPASITSADFNADGKIDLAAANQNSNTVSILLGNGAGSFATAVNFAVGSQPESVTSADFNADGKVDLAVANRNYSGGTPVLSYVSVLLGNGAGSFAAAVNFAVGYIPTSVTSADFNVDGKADLAVGNASGGNVSVLLGNGFGSFAPAINFAVGGCSGMLTSADLNDDGKVDLAVSGNGSSCLIVSVLLGNGAGSFATAVNFAVGGSNNGVITSADFNVDGKADLAVTNFNGNSVAVLLNTPLPSVTANATATTVCSGTSITLTGGGATTYTWTGGVSNGVAFTPPTGSTTYSVTGTNTNGCTDTATKVITVNALPVTSVTQNSNTLTANTASATYQWLDCNNGFAPIVGATTQSYTATTNGSYAVIVNQNSCSDTSVCYVITTGINNYFSDARITIFPNPFSTQTTLQTDNLLYNATLTVYNCFGQIVKEMKNIEGQTVVLFRDNLPSGLYLLRLTEGNKTLVVNKLVITD